MLNFRVFLSHSLVSLSSCAVAMVRCLLLSYSARRIVFVDSENSARGLVSKAPPIGSVRKTGCNTQFESVHYSNLGEALIIFAIISPPCRI